MRKFLLFFITFCSLMLKVSASEPTLYYKISKDPVHINKCASIIYGKDEEALVMNSGDVYGRIKCNFAQLIGIADWYNTKAVNNGVSSSYTINFNVDMTELLETQSNALISPKVTIIDLSKTALSDKCRVGWSGYPEVAELYKSTPSGNFELGIQPTTKAIPKESLLMVELFDSVSGLSFDTIYFSIDVLRDAPLGAQLRVASETVDIESINGAVYQVRFNRAEHNKRNTTAGTRGLDLYDVVYDVIYKSAPSNSRVVSIFDSFDNNKISPRIDFSICSDNDSTLLYDTVPTALEESTDHVQYEYVTNTTSFGVGKGFQYLANRLIGSGVTAATNYVRIVVTFPEERAARTDEEMKDFSGRYLVYQLKLSEHVTPDGNS